MGRGGGRKAGPAFVRGQVQPYGAAHAHLSAVSQLEEAAAHAAAAADGADELDGADEHLRDYLANVQQHASDDSDSDNSGGSPSDGDAPRKHSPTPLAAAAAALQQAEDPDSWRPAGLGFTAPAAARFAAVSLDDALEGQLAEDMRTAAQGGGYETSSSSSSGGEDSASAAQQPVVVQDANGTQWEQLSLQQRFPVQPRQRVVQPPPPRGGRGQRGRAQADTSSPLQKAAAAAAARLVPPLPAFASPALAAVASAAAAAALPLAARRAAAHAQLQQALSAQKQAGGKSSRQHPGGMKQRLRQGRIEAVRVTREARRLGGSALELVAAMEAFAAAASGDAGDMAAHLPHSGTGKTKEGFVRDLASLFGVKAAAQGAASSRSVLVMQATPRTCADPLADDATLAELRELLTEELAKEIAAAAIADNSPLLREGQPGGKAKQQQRQGAAGGSSSGGGGGPDHSAPVRFVAAGVLDPNSSTQALDSLMPATAAAGTGPEQQQQQDTQQQAQQQAQQQQAQFNAPVNQDSNDAPALAEAAAAAVTWGIDREPWGGAVRPDGGGCSSSRGLGFVAAAAAAAAVDEEQRGGDADMPAAPDDDEAPPLYERPPTLGLGFGRAGLGAQDSAGSSDDEDGSHRGLGQPSSRLQQLESKFAQLSALPDSSPAGVRRQRLREQQEAAAAGGCIPVNMTAEQRNKARKQAARQQRRSAKAAAAAAGGGGDDPGAAAAAAQQPPPLAFAAFEEHTTGIGSRLMARWGWSEGQGLGRGQQGRADPLQPERRPRQLGLGYE